MHPLHRALVKKLLVTMTGSKPGGDQYVPVFRGDLAQMTQGMFHNVAIEMEFPLDHKFWIRYWAAKQGDRPDLTHRQVPYFSPQLLACFDTLVADLVKDLSTTRSCTQAQAEEATLWWEGPHRMDGFDESYLGIWDFPREAEDHPSSPGTRSRW